MKILHLSDTHGKFPTLEGNFDVIVHSGDIFPDFYVPSGNKIIHMNCQMDWLNDNINNFKNWINNNTFLYVLGNHDYVNADLVDQILNSENIKTVNLHDRVFTYKDVFTNEQMNFAGFHYIPYINGLFASEKDPTEMETKVTTLIFSLNRKTAKVLVTHSPLYEILDYDKNGVRYGNKQLKAGLDLLDNKPSLVLSGHMHGANGDVMYNDMHCYNSAKIQKIITI